MDRFKLSFLVTSIIMVIGCRDDNYIADSIQQNHSYQAKVIDGYLRNAQVWLDLNGNYKHDDNEPSTYSTQLGDVELDLSDFDGDPTQYRLVALASENKTVDEDHGEALDKSYMLVAPPGVRNITPLSHLVHSKQVSEGLTFEQASSQIADLMEKDQQDLFEDYVEGRETELHAIARSLVVVLPEEIPVREPLKLKQQHSGFESVVEAFKKHRSRKDKSSAPIDYQALELNNLAREALILGDSDMLSLLFEERDSDGDGISDGKDTDDDNDGIEDELDALPRNALESEDSDQDGVGDREDDTPNEAGQVPERSDERSIEQLESQYLNAKKLVEKLQLEVSNDPADVIPQTKFELLLTEARRVELEAHKAYLTQKALEKDKSDSTQDTVVDTPSAPVKKKTKEIKQPVVTGDWNDIEDVPAKPLNKGKESLKASDSNEITQQKTSNPQVPETDISHIDTTTSTTEATDVSKQEIHTEQPQEQPPATTMKSKPEDVTKAVTALTPETIDEPKQVSHTETSEQQSPAIPVKSEPVDVSKQVTALTPETTDESKEDSHTETSEQQSSATSVKAEPEDVSKQLTALTPEITDESKQEIHTEQPQEQPPATTMKSKPEGVSKQVTALTPETTDEPKQVSQAETSEQQSPAVPVKSEPEDVSKALTALTPEATYVSKQEIHTEQPQEQPPATTMKSKPEDVTKAVTALTPETTDESKQESIADKTEDQRPTIPVKPEPEDVTKAVTALTPETTDEPKQVSQAETSEQQSPATSVKPEPEGVSKKVVAPTPEPTDEPKQVSQAETSEQQSSATSVKTEPEDVSKQLTAPTPEITDESKQESIADKTEDQSPTIPVKPQPEVVSKQVTVPTPTDEPKQVSQAEISEQQSSATSVKAEPEGVSKQVTALTPEATDESKQESHTKQPEQQSPAVPVKPEPEDVTKQVTALTLEATDEPKQVSQAETSEQQSSATSVKAEPEDVSKKVIAPTSETTDESKQESHTAQPELSPVTSGENGSTQDSTIEMDKKIHQSVNQTGPENLPGRDTANPEMTDKLGSHTGVSVQPDQPESVPLSDFDKLKLRIIPELVSKQKAQAVKLGSTISKIADEYVMSMSTDGSWQGIDYQSTSESQWPSKLHLQKMNILAAAYQTTKDEKYEQSLVKALEHWFNVNPKAHWWWEEIGKPQNLSAIALLFGKALPEDLKDKIIATLPTQADVNKTGANRTDIAIAVIYHGLLSQNSQLIEDGLKDIQRTITVTTDEGIQPDWSFHQHGAQLYNGGYGEIFLNSAVNWAYRVHDLEWKFQQEKVEILANLLLDGMRWMNRGGQLDYNVSGRGIVRPQPEYVADGSVLIPEISIMDKIATLVPNRKEQAMAYKAHVYQGTGSGLTGFRHYWRSDYSVTAEDGFMFGIKMNSQRTAPSENGGGENLLGYWLGFGSTFLMQSGQEYHNIFPVLDWKKMPGVTAPEYQEAPYYWGNPMQDVSFVGGASDGNVGVTTMIMDMTIDHMERTDTTQQRSQRTRLEPALGNTKARKSWFSFGDQIVALGVGITSSHSENVNTTINQTLLKGPVTSANSENLTKHTIDADMSHSRWVHHSNVGYVFLDNSDRVVSVRTQTGRWADIKSGAPDYQIFEDVFTLSIPHGVRPQNASYQYIILPNRDVQQVIDYQQSLPINVLSNTAKIQAVEDTNRNIISAVFFEPGELTISQDYKVSVDQPSVVILDFASQSQEVVVSLSTPGVPYSVVDVTLEQHGERSTQRVVTPGTKEELGKSIHFVFSEGQQLNFSEHATELQKRKEKASISLNLLPLQDTFVQGGGSSKNNYGSSGYMQVANQGAAFDRRVFLNFDLSDIKHYQVTAATLRLYLRGAKGESDVNVKLVEVENTQNSITRRSTFNWNESTLNFNTLPSLATIATAKTVNTGRRKINHWIEFDVSDLIKSVETEKRSNVTLALEEITMGSSDDFLSFATKERTGYEPQLIILGKEMTR